MAINEQVTTPAISTTAAYDERRTALGRYFDEVAELVDTEYSWLSRVRIHV